MYRRQPACQACFCLLTSSHCQINVTSRPDAADWLFDCDDKFLWCYADLAVLAQIIGAPGTTASTQNSVQNTLQNAPLSLQEGPEKLLIAASLVAVAVGGYLLREKAQKK